MEMQAITAAHTIKLHIFSYCCRNFFGIIIYLFKIVVLRINIQFLFINASSKLYLMRFLFIAFLNLFMNFLIITNLHNIKYHSAISIVDAIEPTMAWFLTIIVHMLFLWFVLWLLSYPNHI